MKVNVATTTRVTEPVDLVVHAERWEYDALVELLDGVEVENGEQAHVLRALVSVLRPDAPATGTYRTGRAHRP